MPGVGAAVPRSTARKSMSSSAKNLSLQGPSGSQIKPTNRIKRQGSSTMLPVDLVMREKFRKHGIKKVQK